MEKYEVVVVGGGHNGLLAAAYLAKAGVKVCVVERLDYVGGGVVTRDGLTAPGFKTDICSIIHVMIQANPLFVNDELGLLSNYGLKYIFPDLQAVVHYHDSSYMKIHMSVDKTCEAIAQFSEKDAESYRRFHDWSLKTMDMLLAGTFNPPPPFGNFLSLLQESDEGKELSRCIMVSALDIIDTWFENEKVKIALTRWVSEMMISPQTMGTGLILFLLVPLLHQYGGGLPVGGSGALSMAIEKCLLDNGGEVKVSCPVKRFKVENGECRGVILEDGSEILASKAVIANLHVKQVYNQMLSEDELPSGFQDAVSKIMPSEFGWIKMDLALNDSPKYKVGPELDEAFFVEFAPNTMVEFLRYFDELRYGSLPRMNPFVACQTLHDKTRAPEGKHTLYFATFAPYNLRDGGPGLWDEIRERESERMLDFMRKYISNLGEDNIVGRWILSPLDLERHNHSHIGGDGVGIGNFLHQTGGNRPLPGWNYRTPIKGLYMCGTNCHPGGGVIGAGRAAIQPVMEDLGIDFEDVIG